MVQAASGISAAMQEACAGGGAPAVAAVCGSKGTGKSTFGRLLLNCLLNACSQVAWLDTDCGQPEFTVPGEHSCKTDSAPHLLWLCVPSAQCDLLLMGCTGTCLYKLCPQK